MFLFEDVMSKNVKLGVVSALSMAVLVGCQSTGSQSTAQPESYSGEMTRTEETNLLRYRDTVDIEVNWGISKFPDGNKWSQMSKGFKLSEPLSFEFPLTQILDCGERNNGLNTQKGTLTLTKVESPEKTGLQRYMVTLVVMSLMYRGVLRQLNLWLKILLVRKDLFV